MVYLCILLDYGSHKINQNTKATISVVVGLPGLVPSPSCGKTGRDGCRAKRIGPSTPDIFILQKVRNEILNLEKMYWRDRIGDQFLVLCIFLFREKIKKEYHCSPFRRKRREQEDNSRVLNNDISSRCSTI